MSRIFVEGSQPEELPEWQSPENIRRLIAKIKIGDIVHIVPKGETLARLEADLGSNQIHGCVDFVLDGGKFVVWSTWHAFAKRREEYRPDDLRTFGEENIRLLVVDKAEEYIARATEGRFAYGAEARVKLSGEQEGIYVVAIDSYFDGLLSGVTPDGMRITAGLNYFEPYQ